MIIRGAPVVVEMPDKPEKLDKPDAPDAPEKPGKPGKLDAPGKLDSLDSPDAPDKLGALIFTLFFHRFNAIVSSSAILLAYSRTQHE